MLDFSADALEGPIRAYLLDVADTEEQDMALNIHGLSAGETVISKHQHKDHQCETHLCGYTRDDHTCLDRTRRSRGLHVRRTGLDWYSSGQSV